MAIHIQVGVIGPLWIRESLERSFQAFPSLQPHFLLSDQLEDAATFTKQLQGKVDCLLFSGKAPYVIAKNDIPPGVSSFIIPLKGAGIYRALYLLKKEKNFTHISVDGISRKYIDRVCKDVGENFTYEVFEEHLSPKRIEKVVQHHCEVVQKKPNSVVITSLKQVNEKLRSLEVASEWLKPTEEDMIVILERMLLSTTQRKQKEMQVVVGRIYVDDTATRKQISSERSVQNRNHQLYRLCLDFAEQFDGYLTALNDFEYLFITNRGAFERITEGYKSLPLIDEAKGSMDVQLSVGIGFGETAYHAGRNARSAVFQARDYGGQCGFIVREDQEVFGPIDLVAPVKYPLSVTDKKLLAKAESIGTNAVYLEKTLAMLLRKNNNQFTAHEVASILGITTRSAHRLLQTWLDAEIIQIVGTEKVTTRGRPRQVFSILKEWE